MRRDREFRSEFVVAHAKYAIPMQIGALMERQQLTQMELAKRSDLAQPTVGRAMDPTYGNLAVNTLVRLAAGFDVALVVKFVPFSDLFRTLEADQVDAHVSPFSEEVNKATTAKALLASPKKIVAGRQAAAKTTPRTIKKSTRARTRS